MNRYESLRQRLVQPFLLLGFIVGATLSLTTFALLVQIEERAIARALHVELESFRHRLSHNPRAAPAESALLRGLYLPTPDLTLFPQLAEGEESLEFRTLGDSEYSVLFTRIGGRPFALLYDRTYIRSNIAQIALLLLVTTAGTTLLSFLIGYRLSRQIVQPIARLLKEVSQKAGQARRPGERIRFSGDDYPSDEIGRLVQELDRFSVRLHEFIERESYFAADVSHELRTPIAVIAGATEVLEEVPDLPEAVRQRVATIGRHARRLSQVVEAMLLLGQEEASDGDPSCVLGQVVEEVVADCRPLLDGRPVLLETRIVEPVVLPVEGSLVYVLISNVVRNACAHTRRGHVQVRLAAGHVAINDTGIGIPEERFPALFQRHAKGEASPGHGLGLSIVARICERLDWHVSVSSDEASGTTFRFDFPPQPAGR